MDNPKKFELSKHSISICWLKQKRQIKTKKKDNQRERRPKQTKKDDKNTNNLVYEIRTYCYHFLMKSNIFYCHSYGSETNYKLESSRAPRLGPTT